MESSISIEYPQMKHYEAYRRACREVKEYVESDKDTEVARRETGNFDWQKDADISQKDFEEFVYSHKLARLSNNPEKVYSHVTYFIVRDGEILGMLDARAKELTEVDKQNGVKPVKCWSNDHLECRAESATMILPKYRGQGVSSETKRLFFDALRTDYGIEQMTAIVMEDNVSSNKAQESLVNRYGGKSYKKVMKDVKTGKEIPCNAYVVNTDTSLQDRLEKARQNLSSKGEDKQESRGKISKLRGIGTEENKPVKTTTLDWSKVSETGRHTL